MRSRAELRRAVEWTLRGALVLLLALALWRALRPAPRIGGARRVAGVGALRRALEDATRSTHLTALDLLVDSAPSAGELRWLGALARSGVTVRWRGAVPALAVAAERVREPVQGVRVLLAAESGAVVVSDSAGALDTVRVGRGGASLRASDVVGVVRARQGAYVAAANVAGESPRRAALVLGRAGWESKFVLAALDEAGWTTRARLPAAPGVAITDPALLPIDTARYDVVIALDSTAADLAPTIARFVASGGGLVVAGSATALVSFRALTPAVAGARRPGRILLEGDTVTPASLPSRPLGSLRSDAVVLERQSSDVAVVAARRAGLGRAIAIGYDESWRWRMLGGGSGAEAHRRWWSRAVGLAAPERDAAPRRSANAAPRAALVEALGPAAPPAAAEPLAASDPLPLALLVLIALALLAETASRRFRGAR